MHRFLTTFSLIDLILRIEDLFAKAGCGMDPNG